MPPTHHPAPQVAHPGAPSPAREPGVGPAPSPGSASTARQRVMDTAFRLFYAHGIHGIGVDRIIAESGVAKATFYKHFPGKQDLVLAYLDQVDTIWSGQLRAAAKAAGPQPRAQLLGMFDALSTACRRDGYRGCAFINAAAEFPAGSPVHERTVAHKAAVLAWVEQLAAQAGASDPQTLARALTLLLDGGLASGSLDGSPEAPQAARAGAEALLAVALA